MSKTNDKNNKGDGKSTQGKTIALNKAAPK